MDAYYFEGIEIGAVSVKWVRRDSQSTVAVDVIRHEGRPVERVKKLFSSQENDHGHRTIVVTGASAKNLLNLPYVSETECFERALAHHGMAPDILVSLGGESFSVYPMIDGRVKNIISTSKCAAGTGEFVVQQFQRMNFDLEKGLIASRSGELVKLATRCSVHCKSDATHKLNKGECRPEDIAHTLIYDLAVKVNKLIDQAE